MSIESNNTPVDPRIQIELEKLNTATDNINKYEVELDEAKCEFKKLLSESIEKIKQSAHKLGNSIEAAKPYYEARLYANQLAKETQAAAINYEKAKSVHAAAKEMVYLAEQGLGEKSTLDTACQEMLSHAASKVNQSQADCIETRNLLKICELKQEVANNRVTKLQAQLKSAIKASRPYYETRANYNGLLKAQKEKISDLENKVAEAKMTYNEALKNLEQISEEIHKMREEKKNYFNFDLDKNDFNKHDSSSTHHKYTIRSSKTDSNIFPKELDQAYDEYLDFPPKLTTKSSPIHQRQLDPLDCPHLLRDFEQSSSSLSSHFSDNSINNDTTVYSLNNQNPTSSTTATSTAVSNLTDEIEQWTEIRLSNSESTSSSEYSHHSVILDDQTLSGSETSSTDDNKKVTCTTLFNTDDGLKPECDKISKNKKSSEGITTWITRSSSFRSSGRRQSFDILIDAGDRVKDVFTSSFQKVGKSLERRNSESEVNNENNDFFIFSRSEKDTLSDEQVENLLLNNENEMNGMLHKMDNISK